MLLYYLVFFGKESSNNFQIYTTLHVVWYYWTSSTGKTRRTHFKVCFNTIWSRLVTGTYWWIFMGKLKNKRVGSNIIQVKIQTIKNHVNIKTAYSLNLCIVEKCLNCIYFKLCGYKFWIEKKHDKSQIPIFIEKHKFPVKNLFFGHFLGF